MTGKVTSCRMCDSTNLVPFLDLGMQPPADHFLKRREDVEQSFPLTIATCVECGLAQLNYVVDPDLLYCKDYPYDASTAITAQNHWKEFADSLQHRLKKDDLVVDIGSNVGVLLQAFKNNGAKVLGVDPAKNIAKIANSNGIETIPIFFDSDVARVIVRQRGQAEVITATNVFAHIDNLIELMNAVEILLKPEGCFVIEVPYFVNLLQKFQYDTIYHEHLSYISIKPLARFLAKFKMEIYNIEMQDFHGGSARIFIRKDKNPVWIVNEFIRKEQEAGIYNIETLREFATDVQQNKRKLRDLVIGLKAQKKKIVAVSAPAKGMTLLNFCKLDTSFIDFVTEKAKLKIGKYTPGTHIPVVQDSFLVDAAPDYALLLAWNFADEIMKNNPRFKGKYIIPIPQPRIVN